jgi:hypothetical protein
MKHFQPERDHRASLLALLAALDVSAITLRRDVCDNLFLGREGAVHDVEFAGFDPLNRVGQFLLAFIRQRRCSASPFVVGGVIVLLVNILQTENLDFGLDFGFFVVRQSFGACLCERDCVAVVALWNLGGDCTADRQDRGGCRQ